MPYPTEHSARVKDPGAFEADSMRSKEIAPGVRIIIGHLKGETTMTTQAYRFDKEKFTPEEAKKWLKDNDVDYISFEPAEETAKASIPPADMVMRFRDAGAIRAVAGRRALLPRDDVRGEGIMA